MDQRLNVYVEVAERKNFTRAAEALHMSQPAVSQYIASLENDLGVKLVERSNKFVYLNKAGEIVYQHAKEILRNYERMEVLVSDLKNKPSGELRIGASYTIGEYVLPQILEKLQSKYPLISPNVVVANTEQIGKKLIDQQVDIGLIEGEYPHSQLISDYFAVDELYIITGTASTLFERKDISKEDLEKQTWIIREKGSGTRVIEEEFLREHRIKPERLLTFGSTQIIKEAVESGMGISLLSKWTFKKELKLGTIHKLDIVNTPIKRNFSIVKSDKEFFPKSLQVFEEIVKQSVDDSI